MAKILANLSSALQSFAALENTPGPPEGSPESEESSGNQTQEAEGSNGGEESAGDVTPTEEPVRSPTPEPTESPPFILQDSSAICDPTLGESLIQVIATDGAGDGIPGITLQISLGTESKETFYTGLKPELGLGYADYSAEPGLTYQLEIPDSGLTVSDIEVPTCQNESGESYWGSWEVYITHPN
jgi:hypothetical protein